jgi:hypothetical protein
LNLELEKDTIKAFNKEVKIQKKEEKQKKRN